MSWIELECNASIVLQSVNVVIDMWHWVLADTIVQNDINIMCDEYAAREIHSTLQYYVYVRTCIIAGMVYWLFR